MKPGDNGMCEARVERAPWNPFTGIFPRLDCGLLPQAAKPARIPR